MMIESTIKTFFATAAATATATDGEDESSVTKVRVIG